MRSIGGGTFSLIDTLPFTVTAAALEEWFVFVQPSVVFDAIRYLDDNVIAAISKGIFDKTPNLKVLYET